MKISTILDHIDGGTMALPEFQRGYVWNRDQVRGLMESLYRKHPVGSLLVWVTNTANATARGTPDLAPGSVKLILDGQQRITSLYGIVRGRAPQFFDGNPQTFTGLHFNLDEETFAFYSPLKMSENPVWVDVTELMQAGVGSFIQRIMEQHALQPKLNTYIDRINRIGQIKEIDLHIDEVTGEDKTVDVVVDIFNRVNSGGTKLSKGDLALAKICAEWPEARQELKARLAKWKRAGYHFRLDWFLRCINTIVTGEALFSALKDVDPPSFKQGLEQAESSVDKLLNIVASRLGLEHDRVLGGRYAFPLMARYLADEGGHFDHQQRDKLLYWYVHTFLWGRYSGATESKLNQDLAVIEESDDPLEALIGQLRQDRGDLALQPNDFIGWSRGARFYPLLYMLTRVWNARDWDQGIELRHNLLGRLSSLQVHHIFPKALLYEHGYERQEVNALANFTFLTQETNLLVSDRAPADYIPEFLEKQPGAVESHWIPMDPNLWKVENYRDFIAARRELLAQAANDFLGSLVTGKVPQPEAEESVLERDVTPIPGGIDTEDEERTLRELNEFVRRQGLPEGELLYEVTAEESGEPLAILDLAWPEGLQPELSEPVAVLLQETPDTLEVANKAGYLYFTEPEAFITYVWREILAGEREEGVA